jgi:hypothetical protein
MKKQLKEKSNVVNFEEIDFSKIKFAPCKKNNVATMKISYDNKQLIIKTHTIDKSYSMVKPIKMELLFV